MSNEIGEERACNTGSTARPINCDQVSWILSAIERYLPSADHPRVSRAREMQKYALLYELMEVAHLYFEDANAMHNGTPPDVMRFQAESKNSEAMAHGNSSRLANAIKAARGGEAPTQQFRGYA